MKKKIILMLTMCALLVCLFVISASATDYNFVGTSDFEELSEEFAYGRVYYQDDNGKENWFSVIRIYSMNGDSSYYVQPAQFKKFIVNAGGNESMTYSEICSLLSSISDNFGIDDTFNFRNSFIEDSSTYSALVDKIYNKSITEEDLTTQYNQGKTAGVTEYKESEEYSNVLSTQYNLGKTDGVAEFKDSEAYETVLAVERSIGASEGVANYLDSTEYADTLQAEYDKGYDDAESEKASNMLGTALGSVGIVVFVLLGVWLWLTLSKKKKRRR